MTPNTLTLHKPGVAVNQHLLALNLTQTPDPDEAIAKLQSLGYEPEYRHYAFKTGVAVLAVLKELESTEPPSEEDALTLEWLGLTEHFDHSALVCWRGVVARNEAVV